jgi:hypothetical protein
LKPKVITFVDCYGFIHEIRISELCQRCPNPLCRGYPETYAGGCRTFKDWRSGRITLEQAVMVKNRQHDRHVKTDGLRARLAEILSVELDYREAWRVAGMLCKGFSLDEVLDGYPVSRGVLERLEEELGKL